MKHTLIQYPSQPQQQPAKPSFAHKIDRFDHSLGLWMTHDPAIFQDPETGYYYIYCTDAVCQRSRDLIHWEMVGKVVEQPPKESMDWVGGKNIWAPDIVKVGKEYRLYCSNSSWGVRQSCIFLAVSDRPEGPFEPRGCVLKTTDDMPVNAIDANIITDVDTGEQYMVYGSFWGGCHVLKLDKESGLAAEDGIGTCVARRPAWMSGAIEGPYMIYNPLTEYYYLFVSYGSLKSDYNIRVGRSRKIQGPFLDFHGRDLTTAEDVDNTIGNLIFSGYQWNDGTAYMGPGHNSVLRDDKGDWYLVCHIREKNFTKEPEPSTMQIRKLYWMESGWPVVSAETYSGEIEQEIPEEELIGFYERIDFVPSLPQGIATSVPMKLGPDHYYECCSIQGGFEYQVKPDQSNVLQISYGPNRAKCHVSAAWDRERNQPTIILSGITDKGNAFWAKKVGTL